MHVKEDQMNVADQNRLRQIEAVTEYGLIDQQIPEIDYTATFQVSDAHDGNYIAVSSRGIKHPDRIEIVAPSDFLVMRILYWVIRCDLYFVDYVDL